MNAFKRVAANGQAKPKLPEAVETAVSEVLREAEELCRVLRERRERRETPRDERA